MKKILLPLAFAFICLQVHSESVAKEEFSRWSVGVEFGANAFDGDIRIAGSDTKILNAPSIGAYVEYGVNPTVSGGLAYNYHRIYAYNSKYSFTSNMHQLYPFIGVNFVSLFSREHTSRWGFWGTVGIGLANYSSQKQVNTGTSSDPVYTDYASLKNKKALTIPVSAQLEYNISDRIAVNARYQYAGFNRDDVEGGGPQPKDNYNGVTNDFLASVSVGLRWKFTGDKRHVRNINPQTYQPLCCNEIPDVQPADTDSLERELDDLKRRMEELENRAPDTVRIEPSVQEIPFVAVPQQKYEQEQVIVFERTMWGINFETDKAVIKSESYPILDNVVDIMQEHPGYRLKIKGHTDDVGRKDYNMDLSRRRAASVKIYMQEKGIAGERIETEGYGDTQPIANNNSAYGRSRNRRVDFVLWYEKTTVISTGTWE